MILSKLTRVIFSFLIFISSLFLVSAACSTTPHSIEVSSGSNPLGSIESGSAYILPNLQSAPLRVDLYFRDDEASCFSQGSDIEMKLYSSADFVDSSLSTLTENENNETVYVTRASFIYQFDATLSNSIQSSYRVKSGTLVNLPFSFSPETNAPTVEFTSIPQTTQVLSPGTVVEFTPTISDLEAGLKSFSITAPSVSQTVSFDGNSTYSTIYSENLSTSKTYILRAEDKLGQVTTKEIAFVVDSQNPRFEATSFQNNGYSYMNGIRSTSYSVLIIDDSLVSSQSQISVTGDFSALNSNYKSLQGSCEYEPQLTNAFKCNWNNLQIGIDKTTNLAFTFNATDSVGNPGSATLYSEVFVDKQAPEIREFYLENELRVRNIFSADSEKGAIVKLELRDESLTKGSSAVAISEDFDRLQFSTDQPFICNPNGDDRFCVFWNLTKEDLNAYRTDNRNKILFSVAVQDTYGNFGQEFLNLTLDNTKPQFSGFTIVEENCGSSTGICDGLLKTGEKFSLEFQVNDSNLDSDGTYFVTGDLSRVVRGFDLEEVRASCSQIGSTSHECSFNNLEAQTGYLNESIALTIKDSAGNQIEESIQIEIFKVNNEERPQIYQVRDRNEENPNDDAFLLVLNPVNRNRVLADQSSETWFEGTLQAQEPGYEIVNYALKECNTSCFSPRVVDFKLYPKDTVVNLGQNGVENFTLKIGLSSQATIADLNAQNITCSMAVLYRDENTLYEPGEIVDFQSQVTFWDIDKGSLFRQEIDSILTEIDKAEFVGEWFDDVYSWYSMANDVCTTFNQFKATMSTVESAWIPTSLILHGTGVLSGVAKAGDNVIVKGDGIASSLTFGLGSTIESMCSYVACNNPYQKNVMTKWMNDLDYEGANIICNSWTSPVEDKTSSSNVVNQEVDFGHDESLPFYEEGKYSN